MRRARTPSLLLLVTTTALLLPGCGGGSKGPIDGARAMTHVQKFVGFGPRPFGSSGVV